jgi:hypothetical protein
MHPLVWVRNTTGAKDLDSSKRKPFFLLVEIIMGTCNVKKKKPNPYILAGNGLKYDRATLNISSVLSLPCERIVLPPLMHATIFPSILGNPLSALMDKSH